ncbi:MAG TPA: hypothetical protein VIS76_02495 [Pseudomonadales bacterium]
MDDHGNTVWAALNWQFDDNFSLGVTGRYFTLKYKDIDETDDGGNHKKKVRTDVYGPVLFVTVGFWRHGRSQPFSDSLPADSLM